MAKTTTSTTRTPRTRLVIARAFAADLPADGDSPARRHYFTRADAELLERLPAAKLDELKKNGNLREDPIIEDVEPAAPPETGETPAG